jgi:hypothetical protein
MCAYVFLPEDQLLMLNSYWPPIQRPARAWGSFNKRGLRRLILPHGQPPRRHGGGRDHPYTQGGDSQVSAGVG